MLGSISCATTTRCVAIGTYIGYEGEPVPVPAALPMISVTTDGGAAWTSQTAPSDLSLTDVTCSGAQTCVAVGPQTTAVISVAPLAPWPVTTESIPEGTFPVAISCADALHCTAVGGTGNIYTPGVGVVPGEVAPIISTSDGATTWSAQNTSDDPLSLVAVSCPSDNQCWAVGSTLAVVADGS